MVIWHAERQQNYLIKRAHKFFFFLNNTSETQINFYVKKKTKTFKNFILF